MNEGGARMTRRRRLRAVAFVFWTAGLIAGSSPARAAESTAKVNGYFSLLTSLEADLQGELTVVSGHPLSWHLALAPSGKDTGAPRKGEVSVTGAGFALRIALDYEPAAGRVNWRMLEGRLNLASWLPALATLPEMPPILEGTSGSGVIELTGEGTWSQGGATGEMRLELKDGELRNDTDGWALEGVSVRLGGATGELFSGETVLDLHVRTITTTRFGARSLAMTGHLKNFTHMRVKSARVEIAGGEVSAKPFDLIMTRPSLDVTAIMSRVGLQDLVVFVPTTLSEAQGRVNGRLRIRWDPDNGIQIGAGELSVDKSEPTTLRLVSSPGFLTEKVPARFTFLPASFGIFSRWFSSPNDAHRALAAIEAGQVRLTVDALEVRLTPDGDERGRTASVLVRARPEQGASAIGEVTFEINVSGPLAAVLRLGMEQSFSLQMH